ncbi:MAG: hypothetical protein ACRDJC_09475 [Thermomicrobiales bacterium]
MSPSREYVLPQDLRHTIARAGIDPELEQRPLQDAIRRAIATRRGYCSWDVDQASWVVTLHSPEEQTFHGRTLEEALAWCLVWLMAPEIGVGPFLV